MKIIRNSGHPHRGMTTLFIVLCTLGVVGLGLLFESRILKGQPIPQNTPVGSTEVFTPSHSSIYLAVRHFFGLRPTAVQPIAYNHKPHLEQAQMECLDCHTGALTGPRAIIPGVRSRSPHISIAEKKFPGSEFMDGTTKRMCASTMLRILRLQYPAASATGMLGAWRTQNASSIIQWVSVSHVIRRRRRRSTASPVTFDRHFE
jgi:hypothetical protein